MKLHEDWIETKGNSPDYAAGQLVSAKVRLSRAYDGGGTLTIMLASGEGPKAFEAHALIPAALVGSSVRKLRRLSSFARNQGRLPAEMDVDDELRAMQVLAKTLDSMSDQDTRRRVLLWLTNRDATLRVTLIGPEESLRLAQERLRS